VPWGAASGLSDKHAPIQTQVVETGPGQKEPYARTKAKQILYMEELFSSMSCAIILYLLSFGKYAMLTGILDIAFEGQERAIEH
jgi:hypothetical protein